MIWMTARRFAWLLGVRGPELCTWPERERDAAFRLLRRSGTAQRALADALAAEDEPAPDPAALLRMQGTVRRALMPPPPGAARHALGAIAACAAAGLYLGLSPLDIDAGAPLGPSIQATSPASVLAALDE